MKYLSLVVKVTILLFFTSVDIKAQPAISRFTIDSGGGTSQGGSTNVSGTIGQADAGVLSGGNNRIRGGFWGAAAGPGAATFTPTATSTGAQQTPTPAATPIPSGLDVKPDPIDRFIDALDMMEWVSRVRKSNSNPEVFFELSVFWQGEYPPSNKSDGPSK